MHQKNKQRSGLSVPREIKPEEKVYGQSAGVGGMRYYSLNTYSVPGFAVLRASNTLSGQPFGDRNDSLFIGEISEAQRG